ncbi:MAG TPA: NnrS family protein [Candidatus Acidoferrales bacterium]|nr:NnrS family protein [Candidatus Acidoferrales bacterium]
MPAEPIDASTNLADLLRRHPQIRRVLARHGLEGCGGGQGPSESLAFFARMHGIELGALIEDLRAEAAKPAVEQVVYRETLADYIYRRFFKAGIAILLTVGGLWGAIALAELATARTLGDIRLLATIHSHAHAMIFGWVGLFVMGFAYQSFPRFRMTRLWRPELANASFYLMLGGIGLRIGAEQLERGRAALVLGGVSAGAELAAIAIFLIVLRKTVGQSIGPRSPYEWFIAAGLGWFLAQAAASSFFFFAKATAATATELLRRVALFDPPLRDVQLLGFAALMIAGVSQRFVPVVYGLPAPRHARPRELFWLMNGSLVLAVASFPLLDLYHRVIFASTLQLAYLAMLGWAVLLIDQVGVFRHAAETDRSLKFIRAAYGWLALSMLMLAALPMYGISRGEPFSHAWWGAHRHAFTVGFVSMMIIGVSSRIVPILSGVKGEGLTRLWGPFLLLNLGCAGRVALEVLTDFAPRAAYRWIGVTGFIEVAALAWWGVGMWRVMNLAKTHRASVLGSPARRAA